MAKGVNWEKCDTSTFPADLKNAFKKWTEASTALDDAINNFKAKAKEHLEAKKKTPEGKVPTFNYTGKALLIAFVDPAEITGKEKGTFQF